MYSSILYAAITIPNLILYVLSAVFTIGAFSKGFAPYPNTIPEIVMKYDMRVMFPTWGFIILVFIFLWLGIIQLYKIILFLRKEADDISNNVIRLCHKSPTTNILFQFAEMLSYIMYIVSLSLWAKRSIIPSSIFSSFLVLICWLATALIFLCIYHMYDYLKSISKWDAYATVFGLQNGWAFFTWWNTFDCLYRIAITSTYNEEQSPSNIDYVPGLLAMLSLFAIFSLIWFVLDISILDRLSRYTITPYIIWMWYLGGLYSTAYISLEMQTMYLGNVIVAILSMQVILFLLKIVFIIYKHYQS